MAGLTQDTKAKFFQWFRNRGACHPHSHITRCPGSFHYFVPATKVAATRARNPPSRVQRRSYAEDYGLREVGGGRLCAFVAATSVAGHG